MQTLKVTITLLNVSDRVDDERAILWAGWKLKGIYEQMNCAQALREGEVEISRVEQKGKL